MRLPEWRGEDTPPLRETLEALQGRLEALHDKIDYMAYQLGLTGEIFLSGAPRKGEEPAAHNGESAWVRDGEGRLRLK